MKNVEGATTKRNQLLHYSVLLFGRQHLEIRYKIFLKMRNTVRGSLVKLNLRIDAVLKFKRFASRKQILSIKIEAARVVTLQQIFVHSLICFKLNEHFFQ